MNRSDDVENHSHTFGNDRDSDNSDMSTNIGESEYFDENTYFDDQAEGYQSNGNSLRNGDSSIFSNSNHNGTNNSSTDTGFRSPYESYDLLMSLGSNVSSTANSTTSNSNGNNAPHYHQLQREQIDDDQDANSTTATTDEYESTTIPATLPAARQHTYLPGTTNPLYPEQWLQPSSSLNDPFIRSRPPPQTLHNFDNSTNCSSRMEGENLTQDKEDSTVVLPILQLEGVFLFPNSTLPLRLKHRSWVNYLSRQISIARDGGIGISSSTEDDNNTNSSTTDFSNINLNNNHNNNDPIVYNFGGNNKLSNRDIQVRIGIITKLDSGNRRRRILVRGINTTRHSEPSQDESSESTTVQQQQRDRSQQNLIARSSDSNDVDDDNMLRDFRMGRWNLQMLRRGNIRSTYTNRVGRPLSSVDVGSASSTVAAASNNPDTENDAVESSTNRSNNVHLPLHERYLYPLDSSTEKNVDPLVNRIGTLATITYTHEDDSGNLHGAGGDRDPTMIVTALTTGRFRVVKPVSNNNNDRPMNHNECQLYYVEEIIDDCMITPPIKKSKQIKNPFNNHRYTHAEKHDEHATRFSQDIIDDDSNSDIYYKDHQKMIQNISKVSRIPQCALTKLWPWKVAEDILHEIASNKSFHGLWKSLPPSSGRCIIKSKEECKDSSFKVHQHQSIRYYIDRSQFDPVSFSFWIAANLPLSESEKLHVLEVNHIERLRFLLDKLIKQRNVIRYIKCKHCGSKIAKMDDLFTVAGAEGTSGAYVNEHGCIHQTVTVKSIEQSSTICMGGPETKDSWFPGYSWTILCCQFCYMHLGWKFQLVANKGKKDVDLSTFWGLSGSNITTGKWKFGM